jgi:hypothetical protein
VLAAQMAPERVFLEHLLEESEKVGVAFARGARQARGGGRPAGEGERALRASAETSGFFSGAGRR